jgi:hypothetical protein
MIEFVPFERSHLQLIEPQEWQRSENNSMFMDMPERWAKTLLADGFPVACAGVMEIWPGRGHAWALLDVQAAKYLRQITRAIRDEFIGLPFRRIEMTVQEGFDQGMRWARLLGFEQETPEPMKLYFPDGQSAYLFSKVI